MSVFLILSTSLLLYHVSELFSLIACITTIFFHVIMWVTAPMYRRNEKSTIALRLAFSISILYIDLELRVFLKLLIIIVYALNSRLALHFNVESPMVILLSDADWIRVPIYSNKSSECVVECRVISVVLNFLDQFIYISKHSAADSIPQLGEMAISVGAIQTCIHVASQII